MAHLRPGELLEERYRILQIVRAEGEGAAYLAEDTTGELGEVAITEVVDTLPSHAWRLAVEATYEAAVPALRTVRHPALVQVFDVFNVGRRHYLITEYVPGELLQTGLDSAETTPPFPPAQVLDWAIQLCSALQHLHSQTPPVILRDLSPSSILITEEGALKLADFGFTRMYLTSNVQTLAAPGYAPPEHYAGTPQAPDPQSDIYALGATLHYLLTGRDPSRLPFVFPDVRELNPDLSPALATVVAKAVALEPDARYAGADAMVTDLRAAKLQPPRPAPAPVVPPPEPPAPPPGSEGAPPPPLVRPSAMPPPGDRPRRQPGSAALLAVLAVLLLGLLGTWAVAGGELPFLNPGAASPTPPAPAATATASIIPIDSPVPVRTATPADPPTEPPTVVADPATATPAPPTGTPMPPTATPAPPTPTAIPASPTATGAPPTPSPTPSGATRFGVVLETTVNVRATPSFNAAVVGQAGRGEVVDLFEIRDVEDRTWYRVLWREQPGWMVNTFLRVYSSRADAETAAVPLRATPTPAQ